jgi:hypothetical protein
MSSCSSISSRTASFVVATAGVCAPLLLDVKSVCIVLLDIKRCVDYYFDIKRSDDRRRLTGREITVNAFTPYLAVIHRQALLDLAQAHRLGSAARTNGHGVAAWRRGLGSLFASAAGTIDPSIDPTTARRTATRSSGSRSGARAMAS